MSMAIPSAPSAADDSTWKRVKDFDFANREWGQFSSSGNNLVSGGTIAALNLEIPLKFQRYAGAEAST
jgi:hypothetical protein